MTTDPAKLAADAIAETWNLDNGKRDRIEEIVNEFYAPVLLALKKSMACQHEEIILLNRMANHSLFIEHESLKEELECLKYELRLARMECQP